MLIIIGEKMKRFALGLLVFCFEYNLIHSMEEAPGTSSLKIEEEVFIPYLIKIPILERTEREIANCDTVKTILKVFKRLHEVIRENALLLEYKTDVENRVKQWVIGKFAPEYADLNTKKLNKKLKKAIVLIHTIKPKEVRERIAHKMCPEWNNIIKLIIAGADPHSFVSPILL